MSQQTDHTLGRSRRRFLQWTGATAVSLGWASSQLGKAVEPGPTANKGLKLGITSYSFRQFDLDHTLAMTQRVGLKHISLKAFHLPLEASSDQIAAVAEKVRQANLDLYGVGVISMQQPAEVIRAFDYAKAAGVKVIIAAPNAEMLPFI